MKTLTACASSEQTDQQDKQESRPIRLRGHSDHWLVGKWCNAIGDSLDDAFSFSCNFESLKAQVVAAVAWSLNGCAKFDACSVLDVRILDGRHTAEPEHRHVDRSRL